MGALMHFEHLYKLLERCALLHGGASGTDRDALEAIVKPLATRSFNRKGGRADFNDTIRALRADIRWASCSPVHKDVWFYIIGDMEQAFIQSTPGSIRPHVLACGAVLGFDKKWFETYGGNASKVKNKENLARAADDFAYKALLFLESVVRDKGDGTVVDTPAAPAAGAAAATHATSAVPAAGAANDAPSAVPAAGAAAAKHATSAAPATGAANHAPGLDDTVYEVSDTEDDAPSHGPSQKDATASPRKRRPANDTHEKAATPPPKKPPMSPPEQSPDLDPYTVLGVSAGDDYKVVREVYRKLLLQTHPDKGGDPRVFRRVQQAWATVSSNLRDAASSTSPLARAGGSSSESECPFFSASTTSSASRPSSGPMLSAEELDALLAEYIEELDAEWRRKLGERIAALHRQNTHR